MQPGWQGMVLLPPWSIRFLRHWTVPIRSQSGVNSPLKFL